MSLTSLQAQQQEIIRRIRMHENKSHAELAMAAEARSELIAVGRKLMLAKKSTLKQAQEDFNTFCGYFNS